MSIVNLNCPVCDNYNFDTFRDVFDDRYGEPNKYKLAKCTKCSHICTFPRISERDLGQLYANFYPRSEIKYEEVLKKAKNNFNLLNKFLDWFNGTNNQGHLYAQKGEMVLDIGCGDCSSLIEIKNLGAKAFGIEADMNVKSIADALNLEVHIGNIEDNPFIGNSFDLIVMNQVIEHIPEPDKCIESIKRRLSSHGKIIFVFPNKKSLWQKITGIKWINWHIPYHLHHFDSVSFENMANKCGLRIISYKTITPNIWSILQIRNYFHNSHRGEPNYLWQIKKNITNRNKEKNLNFKTRKKIFKIILFICLGIFNRFIDTLKLGDSLIFEVKIKK